MKTIDPRYPDRTISLVHFIEYKINCVCAGSDKAEDAKEQTERASRLLADLINLLAEKKVLKDQDLSRILEDNISLITSD